MGTSFKSFKIFHCGDTLSLRKPEISPLKKKNFARDCPAAKFSCCPDWEK